MSKSQHVERMDHLQTKALRVGSRVENDIVQFSFCKDGDGQFFARITKTDLHERGGNPIACSAVVRMQFSQESSLALRDFLLELFPLT